MGTTVPLKPVPFENGDGRALELCPHCHGSSKYIKATRTVESEGTLPVQEVKYAHPNELKMLKKAGWQFEGGPCNTCKGAGTCVVGGAR